MTDYKRLILPAALSQEYRVVTERPLGAGAFGAVYQVHSSVTSLDYACKVVEYGGGSPVTAAKVEQEIVILSRVTSPNIVAFRYAYHQRAANRYLIFMEYCAGGSLESYIDRQRIKGVPMDEQTLWCFGLQILRALKHLESAGINVLHRDLKPANIVISGLTLKLTDFGFSKRLGYNNLTTSTLGSPAFMAPEIIRGEAYGAGVDVWAFGVTMFMLATCQYPFCQGAIDAKYHLTDYVTPVFSAEYSPSMACFVKSLLTIDRHRRPSASLCLEQPELIRAGDRWDAQCELQKDRDAFEVEMKRRWKNLDRKEKDVIAMKKQVEKDAANNAANNARALQLIKRKTEVLSQWESQRAAVENEEEAKLARRRQLSCFESSAYPYVPYHYPIKRSAEEEIHPEASPFKVGRVEDPNPSTTEDEKKGGGYVRTVLHRVGDWFYKF